MKKNQIDDLFARKLRDAELPPRSEAWEKLQARQQTRQRRGIWLQWSPWLAAAGVSLLLVAGWVTWKNTTSQSANQMAQNTSKKAVETPKRQEGPPSSVAGEKAPIEEAQAANQSRQERSLPSSLQVASKEIAQFEPEIIVESQPEAHSPAPSAIESTPEVAQAIPTAEHKPLEKKVVLQLPDLTETTTIASAAVQQQTTPISDPLEADFLNKPRKISKMAKVWQQLKNAKSGEKVDWDEVGFNPNKLIAKATGKTENSEK